MIALLTSPEAWVSLAFLTLMEIVLGIDNIVFIAILTSRLPREQQVLGRRLGLAGALVTRVMLLMTLNYLAHLQEPLFTLVREWNGKDLVLLSGGLFLLWKATKEIYEQVEHPHEEEREVTAKASRAGLAAIVLQIAVLDIVFSIDSVVTAVGTAEHIEVMVLAVVLAVMVMMAFARPVGDFVHDNPSVKVLALAFLVLVGAMLVMEATGAHVSKGYVYSAMAFSLVVQVLNLRADKRRKRAGRGASGPA